MTFLHTLDINIVYNIVDFISFDALILLFPKKAIKSYKYSYDYVWINTITDEYTRKRIFLWFIQNKIYPTNAYAVDLLCKYGYLKLLNKMYQLICSVDSFTRYYSYQSMDWASRYNQTHILEWWYNMHNTYGYELRYTEYALDSASRKGHINVLNFWKRLYLKDWVQLKYSRLSIDATKSIEVLNFWFNMNTTYGVQLKYSAEHLDNCNSVDILNFWYEISKIYDNKIYLKYTKWALNNASTRGNIEILDWWLNHRNALRLKYTEHAIDNASSNGHVHVLEWWLGNRYYLPLKYSNASIDFASDSGHIDVLDWWLYYHKKGMIEFKYTDYAVNLASKNGFIKVLDWWLYAYRFCKIPFLFTSWAIEWACDNPLTTQWWKQTCKKYHFKFEKINWDNFTLLN